MSGPRSCVSGRRRLREAGSPYQRETGRWAADRVRSHRGPAAPAKMSTGPGGASEQLVWTRKRALLWMVSAWQAGKRPAFRGETATVQSSVRSAIDWVSLYLPHNDPMRGQATTYLLTAIWAQAEGESFRDVCRRRGWKRTSAAKWSKWALDHIVDGLNRAETLAERERSRKTAA